MSETERWINRLLYAAVTATVIWYVTKDYGPVAIALWVVAFGLWIWNDRP